MKPCIFLFLIFLSGSRAVSQPVMDDPFVKRNQVLHPPPVPYFFITGLCFGDSTRFINKTQNAISTEWAITNDKGDTIYKSKDEHVAYYFKKRGYYVISLIAYNGHYATKSRLVHVDTVTKANCSFHYCYDEFDNLSACSDQFIWIMPDKTVSTDMFPSYTFTSPGNYPVTLIAKKGNKTDTLQKSIHVRGDSVGLPNAAFTSKLLDTSSTFLFTAIDTLAISYNWYFGDNQGDTSGYRVIHTIDKSAYKPPVNLIVTNGCGLAIDILDPFEATGIIETEPQLRLTIYPNPVQNELNILMDEALIAKSAQLQITDVAGAVLVESTWSDPGKQQRISYDVSAWNSGVYFFYIKTAHQLLRKKFVIIK